MIRFVLFLLVFLPLNSGAGSGATTGFWQEMRVAPEPHRGPPRSGLEVYKHRCKACHGRNTQGAPMPGDTYEWAQRLKQGVDVLEKHSLKGYRNSVMPPNGGCRNCSDKEVLAALYHMLKESGIEIGKDGKPIFTR